MQKVKLLIERKEILKSIMKDKSRLQSTSTEKYYEQNFEEVKELEEQRLCYMCRKSTFDGISE